MTAMLTSVVSRAELRLAVAAGADIIDLKDPSRGALGALNPRLVGDLVEELNGRLPISATVGDLRLDRPAAVRERVARMAATGVDYVKLGLFPGLRQRACVEALHKVSEARGKMVIVMFADQTPDWSLLPLIAQSGCVGAMLDTAAKASGGLRDCLHDSELAEFIERVRALGMFVGLAGSLQRHDIAPLLRLKPDYLGFRGALCPRAVRTEGLDLAATQAVRALMPDGYRNVASF